MNKNNANYFTEPAFPNQYHENHDPSHYHGMSLRDYFAAKAMQMIASYTGYFPSKIASEAYRMADEMIRAREQ